MRDLVKALRWLEVYGAGPKEIQRQINRVAEDPYSRANAARREYRRTRPDSIGKLDMLPPLDAELRPRPPQTAQSLTSMLREVWKSKKIKESFSGLPKSVDPYGPGGYLWLDAVDWIARHHSPPEPEMPLSLEFSWEWPNPEVSQSPKPLGVGDLEEDYEDEGWDD